MLLRPQQQFAALEKCFGWASLLLSFACGAAWPEPLGCGLDNRGARRMGSIWVPVWWPAVLSKDPYPSRLETRTKESNACASSWAGKPVSAMNVTAGIFRVPATDSS